jgi:F0F1-type ATP synthase assembly protein I
MVDPKNEPRTNAEAEYDRLMGKRKGMSGSEFAGVGLQFGITIIVFAFAGIWLDRKLGTSPWFVIVGVFGGAALGFWEMYRAMIRRRK